METSDRILSIKVQMKCNLYSLSIKAEVLSRLTSDKDLSEVNRSRFILLMGEGGQPQFPFYELGPSRTLSKL
jgi:hypothetical protein